MSLEQLMTPTNIILIFAILIVVGSLLHLLFPKITGFKGKTLWEWMSILFVPLVLGTAGLFFQYRQIELQSIEKTQVVESADAGRAATSESAELAKRATQENAQATLDAVEIEQAAQSKANEAIEAISTNSTATAVQAERDLKATEATGNETAVQAAIEASTAQAEKDATAARAAELAIAEEVGATQTAQSIEIAATQANQAKIDAEATQIALNINAGATSVSARCPSGETFRDLWDEHINDLGPPLGCPIGGFWAEQEFQKGYMYWIEISDQILVLIGADDMGTWKRIKAEEFRPFENPDGESPECDDKSTPQAGLQRPVRGFSAVWCSQKLQSDMGFATEAERGVRDNLFQEFDKGYILRDMRDEKAFNYILTGGKDEGVYQRR